MQDTMLATSQTLGIDKLWRPKEPVLMKLSLVKINKRRPRLLSPTSPSLPKKRVLELVEKHTDLDRIYPLGPDPKPIAVQWEFLHLFLDQALDFIMKTLIDV